MGVFEKIRDLFICHALNPRCDLTKFVLNHGDALAMLFTQDPVEQGGLATSQEAGDHLGKRLQKKPHLPSQEKHVGMGRVQSYRT